MNSRTVAKKYSSLTDQEKSAVRRLNMGKRGQMRDMLDTIDGYDKNGTDPFNAKVVLHYDKERIDGWSLIFSEKNNPKRVHGHFYVATKARRRGVGTKIMKRSLKLNNKFQVHPWDEAGQRFFGKFK
jgi:hypothetical protein